MGSTIRLIIEMRILDLICGLYISHIYEDMQNIVHSTTSVFHLESEHTKRKLDEHKRIIEFKARVCPLYH